MSYLYYTLYRLLLKVKTNDTPAFNAMALLTIFEGINIQTIMLLLPQTIEKQLRIKDQVILFAIIPILILMVINYFLYVKNAEKIKAKYDNRSELSKTIGVVILIVYAVGSVIAIFAVSPV